MLPSLSKVCRQQTVRLARHASTATLSASKSFGTISHAYQELYPWRTETELAKLLVSNVAYNEHGLVAVVKPTGLGIYQPAAVTGSLKSKSSKGESLLARRLVGQPKFCIAQVLDYMAQMLRLPHLKITKTVHRDYSGLVLLTATPEVGQKVTKAVRRAKSAVIPYMRYHVIVQGILPGGLNQTPTTERCGIRLVELDEFGDVKEPVYVPPSELTRRMIRKGTKFVTDPVQVKPAIVSYRTLATNRDLAVSLVELKTNVTKWSLVECFLAYKAAFVLGDTYFSRRVKHLLGQPVLIKPTKSVGHKVRQLDPGFEPLSEEVRRALKVRHNAEIPLMVHHDGLTLPGLKKALRGPAAKNKSADEVVPVDAKEDADLIIRAEHLPAHFVDTLDRLKLNVFS